MKFLKISVLLLASVGLLAPAPVLGMVIEPVADVVPDPTESWDTWYVFAEVDWVTPSPWNTTIRNGTFLVKFTVGTSEGPVYGYAQPKVKDEHAYAYITISNGSSYDDPWMTRAECPDTEIFNQPAPSVTTVTLEAKMDQVLAASSLDFGTMTIDW